MKRNPVRICVPVCVSLASELVAAVRRAAEVGDLIEVRLDCLSEQELTQAREELRTILKSKTRPIILTLRPAEFGGARAIPAEDRLFQRTETGLINSDNGADFCDLELDLALVLQKREQEGNDLLQSGLCDWSRTICSYHNFVEVPSDVAQIYEHMAATPAAILKIAVQADDVTDCLPVFRLLERAQNEGRELIAIAMGPAGAVTRILGPSRASYLTFGSLDDESATAPGQLTARDLREVYRIDRIDRQTEITGLIGRPVAHSVSPHIHNAAFAKADRNAIFIPFEVHDIDAFVRRMVLESSREIDWNVRGFSVTAPHKTGIMKHLEWIEPAAKEIGAVNTVVMQNGAIHGYNTDAAAFIEPLRSRFESLKNLRGAVIGAGGAARGVVWALTKAGASVNLYARNPERATALTDQFQIGVYDLEKASFKGFDMVINTTPLGTRGEFESETPATAKQLREVRLAYDLVYNPLETRFMREARAAGCDALGGLEMLVAQAVEQFKLWTGKQPDVEAMRAAAQRSLERPI